MGEVVTQETIASGEPKGRTEGQKERTQGGCPDRDASLEQKSRLQKGGRRIQALTTQRTGVLRGEKQGGQVCKEGGELGRGCAEFTAPCGAKWPVG